MKGLPVGEGESHSRWDVELATGREEGPTPSGSDLEDLWLTFGEADLFLLGPPLMRSCRSTRDSDAQASASFADGSTSITLLQLSSSGGYPPMGSASMMRRSGGGDWASKAILLKKDSLETP